MEGIIFFKHYYEAIKHLSEEDRLTMYETIFDYAFYGIERSGGDKGQYYASLLLILIKDKLKTFDYEWKPCDEDWTGVPINQIKPIRNSADYKRFRKRVLERDEYTCQKCGTKRGTMNVHHIKPFSKYPELRLDVNNGITLCTKCHRKAHKR